MIPFEPQLPENESTRLPLNAGGGAPPKIPPGMRRHAFSFPPHVREAVRIYVQRAIEGLDSTRYQQEPAYTAALLGRLDGTAYTGSDGSIILRATNVNSIARNSAESWSGADLAITAHIEQANRELQKAILAQCKLGSLEELSPSELERLKGQIQDMRSLTRSPKVILFREKGHYREPIVASGVLISAGRATKPLPLADYLIRRVLTTLDGDTRPHFVAAVQDSSLKQLRLQATLR
jgi:hypothetical protein